MSDQREKLERRSSKSRLAKQDEVEELEEDDSSPCSETSDATIVPAAGHETPVVQTPGGTPESNSPEEAAKDRKPLEAQRSTDSDKSSPTSIASNPKVKLLVRSQALCDDASPPPPEETVISLSTPNNTTTATLTVASLSPTPSHKSCRRLEKDGSQSSMSEAGNSPCLSRDSSVETQYTDSTGIDLEEFIKMTLNKNAKDKMMLLKLEQDLSTFIKESKHEYLKFPQMTSYHRMLVHRVAAFFGLDHNVDQSGKCVIVNRTSNTRLPDFKFQDHVNDNGSTDEPPKKQILKRESASFDEGRGSSRYGMDGKKSKSFEEREQNYNQARARIFNEEAAAAAHESSGMLESPITVDISRTATRHSSARSSKEDLRWAAEPRPWSSTDSSGYGTDTSSKAAKVAGMTKASSFGGVGVTVLSRSDSRTSNVSGGRISKTTTSDSLSSGVSSLGSPMTRPPPIPSSPPPDSQSVSESSSSSHSAPSPSHLHPNAGDSISPGSILPQLPFSMEGGQPVAVWVASSLDTIPAGSVLINPQTGQPYTNPDGSVYRYQPSGARQVQQQQSPQHIPHQQQLQQQPQPQQQQASQPFTQFNPPQVMVRSADQKIYSATEGAADMTQQFSQLTLTHQSSTELSEPPGAGSQHQQQQQQQQQQHQQQHMYLLTSPGQPAAGQSLGPMQQPQQMQPQPGYIQTQQVQYYTSPPSTTPQVHIVYPTMSYSTPQASLHSQGSIEGQSQGQPPPPSAAQYSSQYLQGYNTQRTGVAAQSSAGGTTYPIMPGYSSIGPSGDGFQGGGYQQSVSQPTYQPQSELSSMPGPAAPQGPYSQYPSVSCAPSASQPSFVQQQQQQTAGSVYYSSTSQCANGAAAAAAAASAAAMPSATFPNMGQSQGSYRPRTPPNQGGTGNVGGVGPSVSVNGVGVMASGQYISYPGPSAAAPYPQPVQPRPQASQVLPLQSMPHAHSPPQPPFPVVRPNMQMSMQMQTRTTPPPAPGGQYPHVAMVPASQQVKIYGVDQRPPKSVELYKPELNKDNSTVSLQASQVVAMPKGAVSVRSAGGPPYRAPTPLCPADVRLQLTSQPLQQLARPQLQPLFPARPARMTAVASQPSTASSKSQKGRKLWTRSSKDSTSPHSSTESTDPCDSLTCALAGGAVLEVTGLPPGLSRSDLEGTCEDLVKLGARLHPLDGSSGSGNSQWQEQVVLAVFENVSTMQKALQCHKTTKYRLRESTQEPPS